jgi:hypothetical protein
MQGAKILRIERIQNRKLWKVFKNEIEDVALKNKGETNVTYLFHGTGKTPPKAIYESEEGFNVNYSNVGMWGKANYFAFKSSYSNAYASVLPGGKK